MPEVQLLPSPRIDPYAGENSKAVMSILNILGSTETARRRKFMTDNILEAIARRGGAEGISSAALMEPGFSSGIPGILQKIASPFAAQTPGIEDIIASRAIEGAFRPQQEFPLGLTGPQLDAWGLSPEQVAELNRRQFRTPPKRPKAVEEAWHEVGEKTAKYPLLKTISGQTINEKVSEAQSNPDVAAETYRQSLEALGYGDEDVEQLKQIFREGDAEKIKQALERIGIT